MNVRGPRVDLGPLGQSLGLPGIERGLCIQEWVMKSEAERKTETCLGTASTHSVLVRVALWQVASPAKLRTKPRAAVPAAFSWLAPWHWPRLSMPMPQRWTRNEEASKGYQGYREKNRRSGRQ